MNNPIQHVSDQRSNENDQLVYAAKKIGTSKLKRVVFQAVYAGKKKVKTVQEIADMTHLDRKVVLDTARKLEVAKLIHKAAHAKDTAYTKDDAYMGNWKKALGVAGNKKKIDKIPTKVRPTGSGKASITVKLPTSLTRSAKIQCVTVDDIESFKKVKKIKAVNAALAKIPEKKFKAGLLKILQEKGPPPKDWGGEQNDIYTTKLKIDGKRCHAAVALKGPGKAKKRLMQKDMGKNGDQIQRLHRSAAQVFIVQYWREIDQSVIALMEQLSLAKAYSEGRCIYFGIIDGEDSARLMQAYPNAFK